MATTTTSLSASIDNAGRPVDINAAVSLSFEGGTSGALHTIGSAQLHDERLALAGDAGALVIHQHQWRVKSVLWNDEPAEIPARVKNESPDRAFFRALRNGGKGYEKPAFALQVSRLTDAAYRSAAKKKPVRVRP